MRVKLPIVIAAAAALTVGCDQQNKGGVSDSSVRQEKGTIEKSAESAKQEIDRQAKAQKERLDAEAKAAKAQMEAEKAKAQAAGSQAEQKVEHASEQIREAAGSAGAKIQSQVGAESSTNKQSSTATNGSRFDASGRPGQASGTDTNKMSSTNGPSQGAPGSGSGSTATTPSLMPVPPSPGATPQPQPDSTPSASTQPSSAGMDDQKLKQQVQDAIKGSSDQPTATPESVQVEVSSGSVTLKGTVKDSEEKSRIESLVKNVQGVSKVDNQLQVQQQ